MKLHPKYSPLALWLVLVLQVFAVGEVFAAKKDFKGLFGSYRREKFTENDAASGVLGVDLMFSTLLPLTPIAQNQESAGGPITNLNYATFFNIEGGIHYALTYDVLLFLNFGYYDYDTRKKVTAIGDQKPVFQQFDMSVMPMILGVKYRMSRNDIVPYVGLGAGISLIKQKAFFDNSTFSQSRSFNSITAEVMGGFEFYFAANAGIRMELSAYFMKVDAAEWDPAGVSAISTSPKFYFGGNIWSVRYASGLFFLF